MLFLNGNSPRSKRIVGISLGALLSGLEEIKPCGEGWVDISEGEGRCWIRDIERKDRKKPKNGCYCQVEWTAWLGEVETECYRPGERIGMLQPNASIDFTLGGGSSESTKAWDAAVSTMGIGDAIEIFAHPEWAFGKDAIEPHIPANAHIFFELILKNWTDWAKDHDTIYGLDPVNDDDSQVLQNEMERLSTVEPADTREQSSLLDDFNLKEEPKFSDGNLSSAPPIPLDGQNKQLNFTWSETAHDITLRIFSNDRPLSTVHDIQLNLKPRHLELYFHNSLRLSGTLANFILPSESTWGITEDRYAIDIFLSKRRNSDTPSMADIWATVFLQPSPASTPE